MTTGTVLFPRVGLVGVFRSGVRAVCVIDVVDIIVVGGAGAGAGAVGGGGGGGAAAAGAVVVAGAVIVTVVVIVRFQHRRRHLHSIFYLINVGDVTLRNFWWYDDNFCFSVCWGGDHFFLLMPARNNVLAPVTMRTNRYTVCLIR